MDFDISLKEVPVTINKEAYVLVEASEDSACKYRNASMKTMTFTDGKVTGMVGGADLEPLLVHLCLFQGDKAVPLHKIRSWPARVVKALFEKAKEISDLNEDTVEGIDKEIATLQERRKTLLEIDAKKSQSDGLPNSDTPPE